MQEKIPIEHLIGKSITAVYSVIETEENKEGKFEKAHVFIELDRELITEFPAAGAVHAVINSPPENAVNLFDNLDDYPVFYLDENATEKPPESNFRRIFRRAGSIFFRTMGDGSQIGNYKVEWEENKLKYVKDHRISDLLYYPGADEKCIIVLDNSYLVSATVFAPKSTGLAGIHVFCSLADLGPAKGREFFSVMGNKY